MSEDLMRALEDRLARIRLEADLAALREAAQAVVGWHDRWIDQDMGQLPDKIDALRALLASADSEDER